MEFLLRYNLVILLYIQIAINNTCVGARILPNVDQRVGKCEGQVSRGVQLFLHLFPAGLHPGQLRGGDAHHYSSLSSLQIVALTVYSYFLANLLGLQYIESRDKNHDYYFPVFGSLQFVFYVGWLKVAETLINPFGEDDDDFDTNFIVDRNIQFTFLLIDQVS